MPKEGRFVALFKLCADLLTWKIRSNTSCRIVAAFRLPNPQATLWDTSSRGLPVECFLLSSILHRSFLPGWLRTFRAMS
jgi:hypothetical protein